MLWRCLAVVGKAIKIEDQRNFKRRDDRRVDGHLMLRADEGGGLPPRSFGWRNSHEIEKPEVIGLNCAGTNL
jgi:hypothetical protein